MEYKFERIEADGREILGKIKAAGLPAPLSLVIEHNYTSLVFSDPLSPGDDDKLYGIIGTYLPQELKRKQAKDDIAASASIEKRLENIERLLGLRE